MPAKAAADGAGVQVSGRGGKKDRESTPRVPVREVLDVDVFVTDAGTQVRLEIDDDVVAEYAAALAEGVQFPPVVVFRADGSELLVDGFHRVLAYRKAGRSEIEADVYHGTREDALWHTLGANRAHGHRLKSVDKRHAVELAYRAWPDARPSVVLRSRSVALRPT